MARPKLTRRQIERIKLAKEERRNRAAQRIAEARQSSTPAIAGADRHGLVITNFGVSLIVEDEAGGLWRCVARQNLPTPVTGDRVYWQLSGREEGVVVAVDARQSELARPDRGGKPRVLASNVDLVAVVVAPHPTLNEDLVDRYLVAVEAMSIPALLVVNKVDLLDKKGSSNTMSSLEIFRRIGYTLIATSTHRNHGLDTLMDNLKGRTSILVGQSGVGKSSLIKALLPQRKIRIRAVSEATGFGTHTTTNATLYHLPGGGKLIDSPGVRNFEPALHPDDVESGFREFRKYLGQCRFSDCRHLQEPGCALIAAVSRKDVDPRRYASFLRIRQSLTDRRGHY